MTSRVRVFIATSLDGYIAGPGDDLSWMPQPSESATSGPDDSGFEQLLAETGFLWAPDARCSCAASARWRAVWFS